ncbi:MAG: metal-dependent hydrolase [Pseudomonadota bacterium]
MKITWLGHSAFHFETDQARILVDPFLTGNPKFDEGLRPAALKDLTHIALTHGHGDHVGDTVAIAKETGAMVIANADLASWLGGQGVENLDVGNTGGTVHHDGFSVTWVQAFHSSAAMDETGQSNALGAANGLVFHFQDGPAVYHMGDTDIFGDMALINELHQPNVGLVPVGDRFTMGGAVAALACKRYFRFETIIPCHFGTFGLLDDTAEAFETAMNDGDVVKTLAIGGHVTV